MKPTFLFLALILALLSTGCEKEGVTKTFDITYSFELNVPADGILDIALDVFATEQESNAEAQFQVNDTRKELVETMYMRNMWLEIESPSNADFDFLKSLTFYMNADLLPEVLVADKNPIPETAYQEIVMDVYSKNLAEYIKSETFDIRANIVEDESRTQNTVIKGMAIFEVEVRIL